jgi:UDP-N-acetylmuramate--alanine ligase
VIDDYAHHPTEIRATVAAARTLREERGGRLIGVLQPHRYSRTQCFFEEFGPSLTGADHVIVTDVYAAGEEPLDGVSGLSLSGRLRDQLPCTVEYIGPFDDIRRSLAAGTSERDIVLLLGAGSITKLAQQLSAPGVELNSSLGGRRP